MEVRVFREEDLKQVNSWLNLRGIGPIAYSILSGTGFIVNEVACGFLYTTDSALSILDFYITNPLADRGERKDALDEITGLLLKAAKLRGAKVVMAGSSEKTIIDRCQRFGFAPLGNQQAFIMEIKDE